MFTDQFIEKLKLAVELQRKEHWALKTASIDLFIAKEVDINTRRIEALEREIQELKELHHQEKEKSK